jgi:hypothetical protein
VLDATLRALRQDKTTFGRLVAQGTEIEQVGKNVLDSKANRQIKDESGQAIEILTRLAHQKGPISEALNTAAEAVAEGGNVSRAARTVLDTVKRETTRSDPPRRVVKPLRPAEPEQPVAPARGPIVDETQTFGDLVLREEVEVRGTGEVVEVAQAAQEVFEQAVQRRRGMQQLLECVSGA